MTVAAAKFKWVTRLTVLAIVAFGAAIGAILLNPQPVSADVCSVNGRDCYHGYFTNVYDGGPGVLRNNVFPAPALLNVDNLTEFLNEINGRLGGCSNLNSQNQTGAAFIILTMLGAPPGTPKAQACARYGEWEQYVRFYSQAGLINWNIVHNFGGINTRSTQVDVAYYPSSGAAPSIVFYNPTNPSQVLYAIKKDCGNPIGRLQRLILNYNLQPEIRPLVNGVAGTTAEVGDSINFQYAIINNGTTSSPTTNCNGGKLTRPGYHAPQNPAEAGGTPLNLSCPRPSFSPGRSVVGIEAPLSATSNTSYCRTLFVSPITPSNGGTLSTEVCINVVSKPYVKIFGGDVSAGNGFETALGTNSCTTNNNGAIVAWNRGTSGGYSGAGAQYAAQTPATITSFATAQGNVGGAPTGTGLSFANTVGVNLAAGNYGGQFGSIPCIKNYYGERALLGTLPNVGTIGPGQGTYEATSDTTLPGRTLNAGDRWTIYIDGDLRITGPIQFNDSGWTAADMPFLKVVVKGDIFIDSNVNRLDGVYIAQTDGATGGNIYTCATGSPLQRPTLANGAFYSACAANKLIVNGAFIANSVELARTRGSLNNATDNEGPDSPTLAEAINFGPAFWMMQPPQGNGSVDNYDAITSLPPVL